MLLDLRRRPAARPARARTSPMDRVASALADLAGPGARRLSHVETPWASITFSGARHTVVLDFEGWDAVDEGEAFIAALPDHEFHLPGLLVADATIARSEQSLLPEPRLEVTVELLLLDQD